MTKHVHTSNMPPYLAALFDSVQDIIYVRDLEGRILDINASGLRFFGKTKEEMVGEPFPEDRFGQITKTIATTNRALLESGKAKTRIEVQNARGEVRHLESTTTLFHGEDEKPVGAYGVMRDITESIETQESLRTTNEKLLTVMAILKDEKDRTDWALEEAERLRELAESAEEALRADHERKTGEIDDARRLLLSLLPQTLPARDDYELAAYMKTASEVSGDYYDVMSLDDGALVVAVGDATGHGLRAGMLSASAKSYFQEFAPQLQPGEMLARMNRAFFKMNLQTLYMAFAIVRIEGSRAVMASAGIPPILVRQAATGYVRAIAAQGIPLGIYEDSSYDEAVIDLEPGDTILMMSDGLADVFNEHDEEYGYEQILASFAAHDQPSVDALLLSFDAAAKEWAGSDVFDDDLTMMAIRRKA